MWLDQIHDEDKFSIQGGDESCTSSMVVRLY
jgi:hypothetical protein